MSDQPHRLAVIARGVRPVRGRRALAAAVATALALVPVACGEDDAPESTSADATMGAGPGATFPPGTTVRLVTHDSFALSDEVLAELTAQTGIELEVLRGGDAVTTVNQAILTAGDPQGDVLFGIDDNLLTAAYEADLFVPHVSPRLDAVPDELEVDAEHRVTPIDRGDVCVNYDVEGLADRGLEPPSSLAELADERYAGLLVVQDPSTSTPGLAFLSATIAADRAGELPGGWQAFWQALADHDVVVADGWEQAYYGEFSGGSGEGSRPLVVSYATSPPAEVVFSEPYATTGELPDAAPTGVVEATCVRQVEYAGVLRGTEAPAAAGVVVDWLLSESVQADVPLSMFVWPVRDDTPLPEVVTAFAAVPTEPYVLSAEEVGAERDAWVDEWTDIVLQ